MLSILEKSLGAKFVAIVISVLFLILGVTGFVNSIFQESNSRKQIQESASLSAHTMMEALKVLMLGGDQDLVQQAVNRVGQDIAGLSVIDWEGVVKKSNDKTRIDKKLQLPGFDVAEALKGREIEKFRKTGSGKTVYTELLPVTGEKECYQCHEANLKVLGLIQVDMDWAPAQAAIGLMRKANFISYLLILLIVGFLIIFLVRRMIINPVDKLIKATEILSGRAGDLTQKIKVSSQDEIGKLAQGFNKIIDTVREMVVQVRNNADKNSSSAQELSASSQELNASTQEVYNSVHQMAKGATSQAERIEETFGVMEKAAIALKQMVANAQSATLAVNQTTNQAENGRVAAQEAVDKISLISKTVKETSQVIQGLGEKSQQIGEITETITSIADQTNLLALNAAIEAARAGEAGRGFAVVAEEVRKLAEHSAEAVRKIGGLIRAIQTETSRAVSAIEGSAREVSEGGTNVSRIFKILADINKAAQDASVLAGEISLAGQTQVMETERVVKTVNEIATFSKEFASSAQEVSSGSQEQTASMEEVTASAQELAHSAQDLKDMVDKFKVE